MALKREDTAHLASRLLLQQPLWVIVGLLAMAGCIELLQSVPEALPGGHALGEVVRNLAYAIVGALVFQWLVVELPARQRRRKTYDFHRQAFQTLLISGPGLLEPYRLAAKSAGVNLDVWNKMSLIDFAKGSSLSGPLASTPARVQLLRTVVETGVPRALSQLSAATAYIDVDVAHALSTFPRQDSLTTVLQIRTTPAGGSEPEQDAHIVWELLEAARRLYPALIDSGAYDSTIFEATMTTALGTAPISKDSIVHPNY